MQQLTCMGFYLLVSFRLFSSRTVVKPLNSKKKSWRKNPEKLGQSVKMCGKPGKEPKRVKKCEKVPRRFCPLVVAL